MTHTQHNYIALSNTSAERQFSKNNFIKNEVKCLMGLLSAPPYQKAVGAFKVVSLAQ